MSQKLNLDRELLKRAELHAAAAGYSSLDEFVTHLIERELAAAESAAPKDDSASAEDVKNRLRGLGYID